MQIAIVSDIHSNLQAWNAVLLDIRSLKVDRIICLGDIVGYGPNPAEVLASVHENVDHFVMGNHDAVICGKLDENLFNDEACSIIKWTRSKLNSKAVRFLGSMPLQIHAAEFRCTHGDYSDPAAFNYLFEPAEALDSFRATDANLMFVGHTHLPAIYAQTEGAFPALLEAQDFVMEEGFRYIVNPGSVGSPRDGDFKSTYCIFNVATKSIYFRHVVFDITAFRQAIDKAGISTTPSYFLKSDPLSDRTPIREKLDFSPAGVDTSNFKALADSSITLKQGRWPGSKYLLAAGFAGLILTSSIMITKPDKKPVKCIDGTLTKQIDSTRTPAGISLVSVPQNPVTEGSKIPGWRIIQDHQQTPCISVINSNNAAMFKINSDNTDKELRLTSPLIAVKPEVRFCMDGLMQKSPEFSGSAYFSISAYNGKTWQKDCIIKQPAQLRKGGWLAAKQTITIPKDCTAFEFSIVCKGKGAIFIKDLSIERKQ